MQALGFHIPTPQSILTFIFRLYSIIIFITLIVKVVFYKITFLKSHSSQIKQTSFGAILGIIILISLLGALKSGPAFIFNLLMSIPFLLFFAIPIFIGVIIWELFIRRKFKTFSVLILILVSLMLFSFNFDQVVKIKRSLIPEVPQEIKLQADQHMINFVGEQYFRDNFVYLPGESIKYPSSFLAPLVTPENYRVVYDFLPLRTFITDSKVHIVLQKDGQLEKNNAALRIPKCNKDRTQCIFNITNQELEDIKSKYDFTQEPTFYPPYFNFNDCHARYWVEVNYYTKEIDVKDYGQGDIIINRCGI